MLCGNYTLVIILTEIIMISSYVPFSQSKEIINSNGSKPPEIWLSSFQQTGSSKDNLANSPFRNSSEFKNEFIQKFNDTDYIIQYGTRQVVFICQANYPVMWTVPHLKQVEELSFEMFNTDSVRVADFKQKPENQYFQTSLTIGFDSYIRDVFSINFTCEFPKANEMQVGQSPEYISSSIHLYYFEGLQAIEKADKVVQINVPKNNSHDTITIPCRPSIPNASILLEKEIETQHSNITNDTGIKGWQKLTNFTYDPKIGFTVNGNNEGSLFGQYRCTLMEREGETDKVKKDQVVRFNVTLEESEVSKRTLEDIKFKPILNLKGNAALSYSNNTFGKNSPPRNLSAMRYGNPELWCCTGVNKVLPKIYKHKCASPLQCDILKRSMTFNVMVRNDDNFEYNYAIKGHSSEDQDDCLSTTLYRGNGVVFCKGENIIFGDYLVTLFNERLMPLSTRPNGSQQINLWAFDSESSQAAVNISRRIFLTVGHPLRKNQEYDQRMKFTYFIRSAEHDADSNQYVAEYARNFFYVGEPLIPICLGWSTFYSRGAFVSVLYVNGSSSILNVKEAEEPFEYLLHFSGGLKRDRDYIDGDLVQYKFGRQVLLHKDMVSFECWMPQWNTEKWDKLNFELNVLDPIKPKFLRNFDEKVTTVYFNLGKENQTMEWRILGGVPMPIVDVTLDGMRLLSQDFSNLDNNYQKNHVFDKFNLTVFRDSSSGVANDTAEVVNIKISFDKTTNSIHQVYRCQVTNVGGTIAHSFEVIAGGMNSSPTKQS